MSEYILNLRKIVGRRPLLQVEASFNEVETLRFSPAHALPEAIMPPNRIPLAQWRERKLSRG